MFRKLPAKVILLAFAAVLAVASFTALVLLPQRDRLAAVRDECRRETQAMRAVEAFSLSHPDVEADLAGLDRKGEFLGKMLPDTAGVEEYQSQLEAAAKRSGAVLERVRPDAPVDRGVYQEIRLEVSLRGGYYQLLQFLKLVEEGPRFSAVTKAVLPAGQGGEGRLEIRIFSLKR